MMCRHTTGLFVSKTDVDVNLYLEFAKVGTPVRALVNIDQIHSAIDRPHQHWVLKPTLGSDGRPLIKPVASASVVDAYVNIASRSHCEEGHLGNFFYLCIVADPPSQIPDSGTKQPDVGGTRRLKRHRIKSRKNSGVKKKIRSQRLFRRTRSLWRD